MSQESQYTPELGKRICDALAMHDGGLRTLCQQHDEFPTPATICKWRNNFVEFDEMYADAKRRQLDLMAEDIVDISNDDTLEPNDKRLRVDTRKWLLSKLMSKVYGDKLDVTSGGEALAPPSHQIDARIQSIIMQARLRKAGGDQSLIDQLDANALKLLD
jgi:hypothetical protein